MAEPSAAEPGTAGPQPWYKAIHGPVFWPSAVIIAGFVLFAVIAPDTANETITNVQTFIVETVGWYYTIIVSLFVVFSLWVGLGHYGDIKLSPQDEEAEFGLGSWFAMLFAAGMGIGLVFWGVAEPLNHFANPKPSLGVDAETNAARFAGEGGVDATGGPVSNTDIAEQSMVQTFLHWGIHPWAIYVVVGLAVAYMVHRKGKSISIRWVLQPLLGDKVKGPIGDAVDIAAIVGTLFGVATSLGFGVTQVASGLSFLEIVDEPSDLLLVILIGAITLVAIVSVVTGVKRGIRYLSNTNMIIAAAIMLFVLITGPTLYLLRDFVENIGLYLQNLLQLSFDTTANEGEAGATWQGGWAMFYWGWWISWAPFVGVFIARISRGRTIREFVAGVLLVPTALSFLWFTVFGGSALYRELFGEGGLVTLDEGSPSVETEGSLFSVLDALPGGTIVIGITIILIVLFFVTSSDSGSLVVDMLASGGDPEPPTWSRVFWAAMEGLVAIALLLAGGLAALQMMAIVIALPFSVVMLAMCVSTLKELRRERAIMLRIQRRQQRDELTEHVSQSLIDDGLVEPNGGDSGKATTTTKSSR
ncbi:BCCT family transporter [Haloechinothrix halophila]|uniref:BCCT family transporter n=1 Tax=Haloechinothrix halophila TaxID=1069073 RepID=UPI000422C066|nr:BCCT family transporter [Haloechinothrix halophila]